MWSVRLRIEKRSVNLYTLLDIQSAADLFLSKQYLGVSESTSVT